MAERILAICDGDRKYIAAMTKRIGKQKTAGFDVYAFTGLERLLEFSREKSPDLVLLRENLCNDKILRQFQEKLILLTEERTSESADNSENREEGHRILRIYKYQAVSEVMRKVLDEYSSSKKVEKTIASQTGSVKMQRMEMKKPETLMLGIYSPVGRCGKTAFALTLANRLQMKRPTMFLSFELFSGLRKIFPQIRAAAGSLADGVYYLRNGNVKVAEKLLALEQKIGELSFLPPFTDPQDLLYVTDEEWKCVLESLRYETGFEAIVADLGPVPAFCPAILLNFSKIFLPLPDGETERCKVSEFKDYLSDSLLAGELQERIEEVHLPAFCGKALIEKNGMTFMTDSAMDNFVEKLIRQEEL